MFPVIATKFDLSVGLLDWAHSSSSVGDNLSIDSRLQSIVRADEKICLSSGRFCDLKSDPSLQIHRDASLG